MGLPFGTDNGKRKYVCFCCGFAFKEDEFDQYKSHIFENHEENREYIKCPLGRCGSPVRDIRSHFKIFHPSEPIPNNMQMRVMVWKDQGTKKKKKMKFEEGYFISLKNNGQAMHYRSSYERKIYEALENINNVASFQVEPFYVRYFWANKNRKYYPDLKVIFTDGRVEIFEIKPSRQTSSEQNRAKWASCQAFCESVGWKFIVKTEVGIQKLINEANLQD